MQEKRPIVTSVEIGRDEDSAQSLQRKLEGISLEVEAFKATIEKLTKMAVNLIERQHYDAENIAKKQVSYILTFVYLLNGFFNQKI